MAAYPDDQFLQDYERQYTTGLGGTPVPQGWGPQPAVSPNTTASTDGGDTTAAPAPPTAPAAGGLGFGGGGFPAQGMIGLGLGLLAGNPFNRWGPAMQGYQAGTKADQAAATLAETVRQHRVDAALRQQGLDIQREQMRKIDLTNEIRNYNFYKQQGGTLPFMDWQREQIELTNKQSLNPQQMWVPKDPNDLSKGYDLKYFQPTQRGGFREAEGIPPGAVPAQINRPIQTDQGIVMVPQRVPPPAPSSTMPPADTTTTAPPATTTAPPSPTSGTVIPGTSPQSKTAATERGKAEGKVQMSLPDLESTTARMLTRLNELENHPKLGLATGYVYGKLPTSVTAPDVGARINEIQGQNWLAGIQAMRGMGALSDREGARVDQARSRLAARDVSTEDYKKAIQDLREVLQTGLENARKIASGQMKPYEPGSAAGGATAGPRRRTYNPATGGFE